MLGFTTGKPALATLVAAVTGGIGAFAHAADRFPVKPVRYIVPFAAGGAADVMARTIGAKLGEAWGQSVLIDNRTGAGGLIAIEITGAAAPDGYTVLLAEPAFASAPNLFKALKFDVLRDFTPIAGIATAPQVITVHPSVPAKTVAELVELLRRQPGKLNFASPGRGSTGDLTGELLRSMAKVDFVSVPFKGAVPALADLMAGTTQFSGSSMLAAMPHVKAGKLRAVGVTGAKRAALAPDIPTVAEQGLPGYQITQWWGLAAPRGVPRAIVDRFNAEVGRALQTADLKERLAGLYAEPMPMTPEQFGALIRAEVVNLGRIFKAAGIQPE